MPDIPADPDELRTRIKVVMIDELMLQDEPEDIGNDDALFAPDGVGLDSVDALQLVVALEKHFELKIADAEAAKGVLASVNTIASEIEKRQVEA